MNSSSSALLSSSDEKLGMMPRNGAFTVCSRSSLVFTVVSRYSRKKARPMPPSRPSSAPSITFMRLRGRIGSFGCRADSMMLTLLAGSDDVTSVSLRRFCNSSNSTPLDSASRFFARYSISSADRFSASCLACSSSLPSCCSRSVSCR